MPIEVVRYQVVVEWENDEGVNFAFSTELPPSENRIKVKVPNEFIDAGLAEGADEGKFKFEILVREASWNQTAVESCFKVE